MSIAPRLKVITQQLEEARKRYRMGQMELKHLMALDQQVTVLLEESRGTHFESALLCIHALVRSLETLASQKARAAAMMPSQPVTHVSTKPTSNASANLLASSAHALAVA